MDRAEIAEQDTAPKPAEERQGTEVQPRQETETLPRLRQAEQIVPAAAPPADTAEAADIAFMRLALEQARQAAKDGDVPVGAVVVRAGQVVSAAHNRRQASGNALAHAECLAIQAACAARGGWQLWDCTLYVTLEPCPMCAGAILNSRLARVVYGAPDAKAGCCGSVTDLFALPFNHRPAVTAGVLAEESAALLRAFFAALRSNPRPRWKPPAE